MQSESDFGIREADIWLKWLCRLRVILPVIAILYIIEYAFFPVRPGFDARNPLGWWGWFDQGHYFRAAQAIADLQVSPQNQYYPPLYPLLGAVFVHLVPNHPFWLINLASLLWFSTVFVLLATCYVSRWTAVLLLAVSVVANYGIFSNFLIPWTTTLGAALLSTGVYALFRLRQLETKEASSRGLGVLAAFLVSVVLGLMACLRPTDTAVTGILWAGCLYGSWRVFNKQPEGMKNLRRLFSAAACGFLVGPALFLVFNYLVFGSPFGNYIKDRMEEGYYLPELPEKFVSLFLDGYTLYLEPGAALVSHYPWLLLSLIGIVYVLVRGEWVLRVLAVAVCVQLVLLLPYRGFSPTGLWRFELLHYLKWMFPYFALFGWLLVAHIIDEWRHRRVWLPVWTGVTVAVCLVLVTLRFRIECREITMHSEAATAAGVPPLSFRLGSASTAWIDVIGLDGDFNDVYSGRQKLWVDGQILNQRHDYFVLPAPWGIRLLFAHPFRAQSVRFEPDSRLFMDAVGLHALAGTYRYVLGTPKPFQDEDDAIPVDIYNYKAGDTISFAERGNGSLYTTSGWAGLEPWGRWTFGREARLRIKLDPPVNGPLALIASVRSLVTDKYPQQQADVVINGREVGRLIFRVEHGGTSPQEVVLRVPPGVVGEDGKLQVVLKTPDSVSPMALGASASDDRRLALGFVSMRIAAATGPDSAKNSIETIYVGDANWPLEAKFTEGFYDRESDGAHNWRWCQNRGTLRITNKSQEPARARIGAILRSAQNSKVAISSPIFSDEVNANPSGQEWQRTVLFPPGESVLTFTSDANRTTPAPWDKRVLVFSLYDFTLTNADATLPLMKRPIEVRWGAGAFQEETSEAGTWHWCGAACDVVLVNPSSTDMRVHLTTTVCTGYERAATLAVRGPALSDSQPVSSSGRPLSYTVVLPPGQCSFRFSCDAPMVRAPHDPRHMVFKLLNLGVKSE